jgi:hypothetical protein
VLPVSEQGIPDLSKVREEQRRKRSQRVENARADVRYFVRGGCTWRRCKVREHDVETMLANFEVRIVGDVIIDDGEEEIRHFEVESRGRRFTVPAASFHTLSWIPDLLGAEAIIEPGQSNRDHLRAAIQKLSRGEEPIPVRTVYTTIGWRESDGVWKYLHAGGAIGADGHDLSVEVQPDYGAHRFVLPEPPTGDALKESVAALMALTGVATKHVAYPLLAALARSVIVGGGFTLWIAGQTGIFKTAYAALFQQAFGAAMDGNSPPASWESTANNLEHMAHVVGHALLLVDDFAPQPGRNDMRELQRKASRLLRAQGNRTGRGRLTRDGRAKMTRPPRGLIVVTAEDMPDGHSIRARTLLVDVVRGDIDAEALTAAQAEAADGIYAEALAAYLQHLAADLDNVRAEHRAAVLARRRDISATHRRSATNLAEAEVALEHILRWAESVGAIGEGEAAAHMVVAREAFDHIAERTGAALAEEDIVGQFLGRLATAVSSGKAHVASPLGSAPASRAAAWGWPESDRPQGARIGWLKGGTLYLDMGAALKAIEGASAPMPVGAITIGKRLADRGLLLEREGARLTAKVSLDGVRRRVYAIPAGRVLPEADEEGGTPPF